MTNKAFRHISEIFQDKAKNYKRYNQPTDANYSIDLNNLIEQVAVEASKSNDHKLLVSALNNNISNIGGTPVANIRTAKNKLITAYRSTTEELKYLHNEEETIMRIEAKAHRQSVIYRFLTTLVIGAGILLTYWIGGYFDIELPAMRPK